MGYFFEILRSLLFSGLPWNLLGYSLFFWDIIPQIASKISIYGLTFISLIFFTIPYFFLHKTISKILKILFILALCLTLMVFLIIFGYVQMSYEQNSVKKSIKVRLIQPNTKQIDKWSQEERYNSFVKNIEYSKGDFMEKSGQKPDYIIWSEAASTIYFKG